MGTGERRDVVIDFSNYTGQTITLTNNANTPYPNGTPVDPQTTGLIMQFKVTKPLSSTPKAVLPSTLRPPITPLTTNLPARKLILFEGEDEYSRLKVMLGTFENGVMGFSEPITENIQQGNTEIWEIYNETEDAHPIHLHQVQMQLVNRQEFSASVDMTSGKPSNVQLLGDTKKPEAGENGWKDTYIMYPEEVTRVIATFDLAGLYAWHCHILSHEDHEMMRPFFVQANATTSIQKAVDATPQVEQQYKLVVRPKSFQ